VTCEGEGKATQNPNHAIQNSNLLSQQPGKPILVANSANMLEIRERVVYEGIQSSHGRMSRSCKGYLSAQMRKQQVPELAQISLLQLGPRLLSYR
jgi:hypothetical protein